MPLMSTRAWDWCLAELQDKAALFGKTGRVLVFNTGSAISNSDTLVTPELQAELRGVTPLLALPDAEKDWHPNSERQVLNLIHPSLFPLVYGRTRVLMGGGQVDLDGFLNSCERGNVASNTRTIIWMREQLKIEREIGQLSLLGHIMSSTSVGGQDGFSGFLARLSSQEKQKLAYALFYTSTTCILLTSNPYTARLRSSSR